MQNLKIQAPERSKGISRAFTQVTPDLLRRAMGAARAGEPGMLFGVLDFFLSQDDEIPSALESLISACVQDGIEVVPLDESDEAARQAEEAQAVVDNLDVVALMEELLLAHYYGVSSALPIWDAYGYEGRTLQAPVTYELLPNTWIYAKRVGSEKYTTLHVGRAPAHTYDPGDLLLLTARKLVSFADVDFIKLGKGIGAARFGIYSWYDVEDWAGYNEVLGIPTVLGTLLKGAGKKDREMLEAAVKGITSDSRAIKTEQTLIEFLERKTNGTALYKEFLHEMARIKSKSIKGESLTDNMGDAGSFAAMRTTNGIRVDVAQRLATRGAWMLTRRLLNPFLDKNYNQRLCRLQWDVTPAPDERAEIERDRFAMENGIPLSVSEWRRRTGRRAPTDDEDTMRRPNRAFNPFAA